MKIGCRFRNLFGIKCTDFYSNLFRFDIFIVECVGVTFSRHSDSVWSSICAYTCMSRSMTLVQAWCLLVLTTCRRSRDCGTLRILFSTSGQAARHSRMSAPPVSILTYRWWLSDRIALPVQVILLIPIHFF